MACRPRRGHFSFLPGPRQRTVAGDALPEFAVPDGYVLTFHRFMRRARGFAGRLPWLAFLWVRWGLAMTVLAERTRPDRGAAVN